MQPSAGSMVVTFAALVAHLLAQPYLNAGLNVFQRLVLISQASVSMSLLSQLFASSLVLEFDIVVRSGQLLSAPSYSYWQSIWISTTSLINRRLIKRPLLVPLF